MGSIVQGQQEIREIDVTGRVFTVNLTADIERFYLRMLLMHVNGPTSFQDISTYNRIINISYI